jgi:hypothetical protein
MVEKKKQKFYTIGQIDATGVRGPHEKELDDMGRAKVSLFVDLEDEKLKEIVEKDLGAKLEDIGFDEDWTITLEFFPKANIHLSYFYYGDEFGDVEAEFRFLFSGERVYWIPGEDSATYIDIIFDFIERRIKNRPPYDKSYDTTTDLMKKVFKQRKKPFKLLKANDKSPLEEFINGKVWKTTNGWRFKKEVFPEIYIEVTYNQDQEDLTISYSGENLEKMGSYHLELIGIFIINHILRYITISNQDEDLPDICYMMFSRLLTKEKGWIYRKLEGLDY